MAIADIQECAQRPISWLICVLLWQGLHQRAGCDMANVAVELAGSNHPARLVIEEFKTEQRNRLARLCRDAGIAKADLLADTLSLLLEDARVSRQSVGIAGPCVHFISMAEAVVAAFARESRDQKRSRRPGRQALGNMSAPS